MVRKSESKYIIISDMAQLLHGYLILQLAWESVDLLDSRLSLCFLLSTSVCKHMLMLCLFSNQRERLMPLWKELILPFSVEMLLFC